jgi:P4 family phage/plasmid primase-like protien
VDEVEVHRLVDELLVELGKEYDQEAFVQRVTPSKLASLAKMMRPHDLKVEMENTEGLIHTRGGLVKVDGKKSMLIKYKAVYNFRHSSEIAFKPTAKCPKFLNALLKPALSEDDINLVQKYCGSMLIGANTCHGIMVIRGTPGGGKSTLVTIIEKVIGEQNVAHLRTGHLGGRFETSAFLGKRLLVGKDVPGDTLAVNGARMLKSLVGGDLMQAEIKFNPDKQPVRGDYHVMIVSNNKLQIALDGDAGAWRRRLLMVDFNGPKPDKPIANLAEKLFAEESSGILNWMIEGAKAYRAEMEKHGHLSLTEAQQQRVETLLEDSDNVPVFVERRLFRKNGKDVSSEELLLCYHRVCKEESWTPVTQHKFQTRIPEILAEKFNIARRNDIKRNGRAVRGFKDVVMG